MIMATEQDVRDEGQKQGLTEKQIDNAIKFARDDSSLSASDAVSKAKSS